MSRKWGRTKAYKFKVDRPFSAYIRLRDTDENGFGRCITCQRSFPFSKLDCGHYQSRSKLSTRWDEKNAHAQCHSCNRFNGGEQMAHAIAISMKYGQEEKEKLDWRANHTKSYLKSELDDMAKDFRQRARELFDQKSDYFKAMHKGLI